MSMPAKHRLDVVSDHLKNSVNSKTLSIVEPTAAINPFASPDPTVVNTTHSRPNTEPTAAKMPGSPLTTHVLDTSLGQPARSLPIHLYKSVGNESWSTIAQSETNSDGRCPGLLTQEDFKQGIYKIKFDTGRYFRNQNTQGFYPYVEVVFEIIDPSQHYHVPLLLSPYSYSTYRGS